MSVETSHRARAAALRPVAQQLAVGDVVRPGSIGWRLWDERYRLRDAAGVALEASLEDTWARVAGTIAQLEAPGGRALWSGRFFEALKELEFLPAGRILAGAGAGRAVTLLNCFVMGPVEDTLEGVLAALSESALTLRQGGGVGLNFSRMRPHGDPVAGSGAGACGPVKAMVAWDSVCGMLTGPGGRRAAMMGVLACDHPDIEAFIGAKANGRQLTNFNLSVLVSDAFMAAVKADIGWDLAFSGNVYRRVRARDLWQRIMRSAYESAEPGVIFIDRVNAANTLSYCETIGATNPCGEVPLPPYGACVLGSINLARLVRNPFAPGLLDEQRLAELVASAVRFLDNVIDVSGYPLAAQASEARAKRRIGLGITGLADALAQCGLVYGTAAAADAARRWMRLIERAAFTTSAQLAAEKGPFPAYNQFAVLQAPTVQRLDGDVRDLILRYALRNGQLLAIAPAGTISLLAGNVSSGIEPIFDLSHARVMVDGTGQAREEALDSYALRLFRSCVGADRPLPEALLTAHQVTPAGHLAMQAAVQERVDGSISKTINCPEAMAFENFAGIYLAAYDAGLKGCTAYRPNAATGAILRPADGVGAAACATGGCGE